MMTSPFPGMDPFIESQRWQDFHTSFVTVLREQLMPRVRPRYVVQVEEYVYLAREGQPPDRLIEPDVSIVEAAGAWQPEPNGTGGVALANPTAYTMPMPRRFRQAFLTIRTRDYHEVVTVIEALSPWNKSPGDGRTEYLVKRTNIFASHAHLVELDLLRGGQRLPTIEPLQPADYFAFVLRRPMLPKGAVYGWTLRQPLPTIPIPLAAGDPDVTLDLQAAFTTTYDRAGYDYSLDYRRPLDPPLTPADAEWAAALLNRKS